MDLRGGNIFEKNVGLAEKRDLQGFYNLGGLVNRCLRLERRYRCECRTCLINFDTKRLPCIGITCTVYKPSGQRLVAIPADASLVECMSYLAGRKYRVCKFLQDLVSVRFCFLPCTMIFCFLSWYFLCRRLTGNCHSPR